MSHYLMMNPVIAQKSERLLKIEQFTRDYLSRSVEELQQDNSPNELQKRRSYHKAAVHVMVLFKLWARALEDVFDYIGHLQYEINRARKTQGDPYAHEEAYTAYDDAMNDLKAMRIEHGTRMLDFGQAVEYANVTLSANELQTALSIPVAEWERHCQRQNTRDIPTILFISKIGDSAMASQVLAAAIHEMQADLNAGRYAVNTSPHLVH